MPFTLIEMIRNFFLENKIKRSTRPLAETLLAKVNLTELQTTI
jgi:hypothetical protein